MTNNSFNSLGRLNTCEGPVDVYRLDAVPGAERLSFSRKVILENLLRHEDGDVVTRADIEALLRHDGRPHEIAFHPGRVFLHDTNGVPVLTDLAALRDGLVRRGLDPTGVDLRIPAAMTVDHSVSVDYFNRPDAAALNVQREYERNQERYRFLKWGQQAFHGLQVIPPGAGIMHQINIEWLAEVITVRDGVAFPDTVVGTDSHTTMVNGLSVLAWGVGGIEAEAAMLGQPVSTLIPPVVGVELTGTLRPGVTATDLVLTITEQLRALGVVGKIIEFFGEGVTDMSVATRCTIANMSPEFGSTAALFPIDGRTLDYLRLTDRSADHVATVEAYAKEQGLWHDPTSRPRFDQVVTVDLDAVVPSLAGPRRPQDRVDLPHVREVSRAHIETVRSHTGTVESTDTAAGSPPGADTGTGLQDGAVAIAAITSCTNTSNPAVMVAAGLLARNAVERGLTCMPWVKTSLAPGSRVVTDYLERAGLTAYLDKLGFGLVGYGCMTCIGNSGQLIDEVAQKVADDGLVVASVTSGNRNFDGRINNDVALNYLASPPLVVAYGLAGTVDINLETEPIGTAPDGTAVHLADIWPEQCEIDAIMESSIDSSMFTAAYEHVLDGDEHWQQLEAPTGTTFDWDPESTYLQGPPFVDTVDAGHHADGLEPKQAGSGDISGARVLQLLGDSVTTDHICPAGRIPSNSAAGRFLGERGVTVRGLNTYASRRGNWQVMRLGGFGNLRLRNELVPQGPGGRTIDFTRSDPETGTVVADNCVVADSYRAQGIPAIVIAGKEYGTGSSRDWAAKVTRLLGIRAVLAESFERIHRSNLIGMGVLPLEFVDGDTAQSLGLDGTEEFDVTGVFDGLTVSPTVQVTARHPKRSETTRFTVKVRLDTSREIAYFRSGGLLPYVLEGLVAQTSAHQPLPCHT